MKKKKKIAIDARMWGAEFTGIGNYINEMCTRLFMRMPNATFFLFLTSNKAKALSLPENVRVVIADEPIYSWKEQTAFCKKIRAVRADITWFPHFNVPLFFRGHFVTTVHDLTIVRYPGKKMKRFWHRMAYFAVLKSALRRARTIVSVSRYTKQEILRFVSLPPKKVKVIHNGVDVRRFGKVDKKKEKEYREQFGEIFFLISGVWREHKNIPTAITAFEMYKASGGKGGLVITGKPDPLYAEVQERAQTSRWKDNIFLTGFVPAEDMASLFSAASVFVFPSFAEGFGLPALEAMAANTPVVASNSSSLPEVCGDAALYFSPDNPEEMALAMVDALREKKRNILVQKGRERIHHFSWDTAAEKLHHILERACKK